MSVTVSEEHCVDYLNIVLALEFRNDLNRSCDCFVQRGATCVEAIWETSAIVAIARYKIPEISQSSLIVTGTHST